MPKNIDTIGVQIPEIYLPSRDVDPVRWAVIACDQYTSEPEYWRQVEGLVGDAPSTLRLTFPEVYLEEKGGEARIAQIQAAMNDYLSRGILESQDGMVYVERTIGGRTRRGLVLALDLEHYDFTKSSTSLIRATEGTIVDRLPPRIKVRSGAPLELPHILVLIDDPERTVIEPLAAVRQHLTPLYDFELMLGSGHLAGWRVSDPAVEAGVIASLESLADRQTFAARYGLPEDTPVLLFAMGDGNHSLATAKAIWDQIKGEVGLNHPARYALVEIENLHDAALTVEPIHRALFGVSEDILGALRAAFGVGCIYTSVPDAATMAAKVDSAIGPAQMAGMVRMVDGTPNFGVLEFTRTTTNLAVGTLQNFLDDFLKQGGAEKIDYVHGGDVIVRLGLQPGNVGFYLAGMQKDELFRTVILDGALPRKTFSMGEAHEKRFYMEARKIG